MMTHWKKNFDPNWIGTYVLPEGQPIEALLLKVVFEHNIKVAGQAKDSMVAYFATNAHFDKPMLFNKTNCRRMTMLTGTPEYEKWINVPVFLTQEMSKMADGSKDYALRIGFSKPVVKTVDYSLQQQQLRECKTIEDLAIMFKSFTPDQQAGCVGVKDEMKGKLA